MNYIIQGNILKVNEDVKKVNFNTFVEIPDTITEIILPDGVEIIDDNTFFDNVNIEIIHIPSTLNEIGNNAFFGLDSLKYLYIPKSVKIIKDSAIINCKNCTILVENEKTSYLTDWYKNIKDIKFNISKDKLREEIIKILYLFDNFLSEDTRCAFIRFTIELFKIFPNFEYDEELELAYFVAAAFVRYMESLINVDNVELDRALQYIEKLHKDKNQSIKELATIGFVECIQNTWSEENKNFIYPKLGLETKKSWDDLNKFWENITRDI